MIQVAQYLLRVPLDSIATAKDELIWGWNNCGNSPRKLWRSSVVCGTLPKSELPTFENSETVFRVVETRFPNKRPIPEDPEAQSLCTPLFSIFRSWV